MEVFRAEMRMGSDRGDLTRATREVAVARRIKYETLKRAVSRNRHLRALARGQWTTWEALPQMLARQDDAWNLIADELRRRMLGMPEDVREALSKASGVKLLKFLRANRIDITCPTWFIEAIRESRDLMSPK